MHWGEPQNFRWLWLTVAFFMLFFVLERFRRRRLRKFGDAPLVEQLTGSLDRRKRGFKHFFILAAVTLLALSLARPQLPGKTVLVEREGLDMVIAVDVSLSMLADDILPSRLGKAKLELQDLVDRAEGDRIGVLAFAGQAYVQVPLTLDRQAVKLFIKTLSPD